MDRGDRRNECWSIANEIDGITIDEVIEYNKDVNPSKLKIGQVISLGKVKVSKPTPVKQSKPKTVTGTTATIQSTLNSRYRLKISVDNIYGDETKGALVRGLQTELNRQTSARLVVDGKFGSNTREACINLKRGARGNLTWILQAILHCRGFKLGKIDGVFGTRTRNAVRNFQSVNNLAKDGIAGPQTFSHMFG
ncbi:hypothetical protein CR203_03395 [Salipaludibacillus neizhouensis]|uniref:LysM domain-containing protein n=1 Tax=Salipaludibacillus neizhouensis TaxID=885475 RepID=A0A3A9KMH5_9BACI|nr:peptidoglycan-binding protein [Salipaludibacillus neizhouensis]RKL69095.1 hypothetical protein CR203_03395 [Salipaludibacillus neizhouensis]